MSVFFQPTVCNSNLARLYLCVRMNMLVSWSWLRIPGVLQRLGFTYFVLALMQTFSPLREIPLREVGSALWLTFLSHQTSVQEHTCSQVMIHWRQRLLQDDVNALMCQLYFVYISLSHACCFLKKSLLLINNVFIWLKIL